MQEILIKAGCYIAIIILGYVLRQRGFFGPETFGVLSKIVIKITLPCAIIASSAGKPIDATMLTISALGLGGGIVYMIAGWLMYRKADREQTAFAVLNVPGYNIGTFALPFTQGFLGPVGVLTTSLFDVGNSFICLGGSYGVARAIKEGGRVNIGRILRAPLSSIPFLTHVVLVVLNLLSLDVPGPIVSFAGIVGNANAFLAMLMIGVGFKLSGDRSQLGSIVKILTARYAIAGILAMCYYFLLPFDLEIRQALVILAFSPIGSAVPVFTAEMKSDVGLSSAINSIAIVISIVIIVTLLLVML
ncbi:MAG: AEC family transporter [Oscillospiraceae bacterium]|nr:AEC family transporter [Oscillospiraceae bacterium]MBQ8835853.1 AEC family transporter [Oscillospiraceae bacterium]